MTGAILSRQSEREKKRTKKKDKKHTTWAEPVHLQWLPTRIWFLFVRDVIPSLAFSFFYYYNIIIANYSYFSLLFRLFNCV